MQGLQSMLIVMKWYLSTIENLPACTNGTSPLKGTRRRSVTYATPPMTCGLRDVPFRYVYETDRISTVQPQTQLRINCVGSSLTKRNRSLPAVCAALTGNINTVQRLGVLAMQLNHKLYLLSYNSGHSLKQRNNYTYALQQHQKKTLLILLKILQPSVLLSFSK